MPNRLDATYIAEDGSKQIPVMIHRAILGSLERFMGILIEHYAGKLPLWLSPIQASVMTISEKQNAYAEKVTQILQKRGIRVRFDLRNEKIGFKIREHTLQKIPYLLIVGDKEVESEQVAVRSRDGLDLGVMTIETICGTLQREIVRKGK
jgi:threonyl-tRNA synthetase